MMNQMEDDSISTNVTDDASANVKVDVKPVVSDDELSRSVIFPRRRMISTPSTLKMNLRERKKRNFSNFTDMEYDEVSTTPKTPKKEAKNPPELCLICSKPCRDKYGMRSHIITAHPDTDVDLLCPVRKLRARGTQPTAPCNICKKKFLNNAMLRKHIQGVHSDADVDTICPRRKRRSPVVSCALCKKEYSSMAAVTQHMKQAHRSEECPPPVLLDSHPKRLKLVECPLCGLKTLHLRKHVLKIHPEADSSELCPVKKNTRSVYCPVCSKVEINLTNLCKHLLESHTNTASGDLQCLSFTSETDFWNWKHEEERRTQCLFVKKSGSGGNNAIKRFYCHRSGPYRPCGQQKRHLKIQGSCKMGVVCPAFIKATFTPSGIVVTYASVHVGHGGDMSHVNFTRKERRDISRMLKNNIPYDEIISKVRDNLSAEKVSRLHLLQKQDLQNFVQDSKQSTQQRNEAQALANKINDGNLLLSSLSNYLQQADLTQAAIIHEMNEDLKRLVEKVEAMKNDPSLIPVSNTVDINGEPTSKKTRARKRKPEKIDTDASAGTFEVPISEPVQTIRTIQEQWITIPRSLGSEQVLVSQLVDGDNIFSTVGATETTFTLGSHTYSIMPNNNNMPMLLLLADASAGDPGNNVGIDNNVVIGNNVVVE